MPGAAAIEDLELLAEAVEGALRGRLTSLNEIDLGDPAAVAAEFAAAARLFECRLVYGERGRRLRRLVGRPARPHAPWVTRPASEEVHGLFVAARGEAAADALPPFRAWLAGLYRGRLDGAAADLSEAKEGLLVEGAAGRDQDASLARIRAALATMRDIENRLGMLAADMGWAARAQADRVARVIADAGGPEAVANGVREARLSRDAWEALHPDWRECRHAQGHRDELARRLNRMGLAAGDGAAVLESAEGRSAVAELTEASAMVERFRTAIDTDLRAGVGGVVGRAAEGDDAARAEIEREARSAPGAFPAGFAEALGAAWLSRLKEGPIVVALMIDEARRGVAG
jgi:hypothetical protein